MGNVVTLQGTLLAGPPKASGGPSALVNSTFDLLPPNKLADVSCYNRFRLDSASSYATLPGIGAGQSVTRGTFLYVRTRGKLVFRITQQGDSGDVVSVLYVEGLHAHEFPANNYLKLLEAQGVGDVEYFSSGTQ